MARIAPWLPRAGAALATAAFFLPQFRAGDRAWSPFGLCRELGDLLPLSDYLYHVFWIVSWLVVPLLLLAAAARGRRGVDWVLLVLLLVVSFSLSTLGSVLLTTVELGISGTSTGLSLALFAVPLALAAVAVGRVLGSGEGRVTGGLVRASLGVLLALHSAFVAGSWWAFFGSWPSAGSEGRTLPWAWLPLVGGLLLAAGELQLLLRPPAPAPAPARAAA